jgi:glycosyltransferase involved in cell wall biosynthesis
MNRPGISIVLPTYDRAAALRVTLPSLLAVQGVDEVVVVDDASTDETPSLLAALADPRLVVVGHRRNRGAPASRNEGAAAARHEWLLFAEDDCCFPRDWALVLAEDAVAHRADIVAAPMVHPRGRPLAEAVAEARRRRAGVSGLDAVAGFPEHTVATPQLPAPARMRRSLVLRVGFDEGFRGNAYREETDFYLRAMAAGARCVLTPRTFFWEAGRWSGGQERSRLAAEFWTARNNWRFLRRHRRWLLGAALVRSPAREQAAFLARRARRLRDELR